MEGQEAPAAEAVGYQTEVIDTSGIMQLTSLTISGFKSFPSRTRIRFSRRILAIVGPNGCGKSNIVDAFRWVLGEQSPRMLRARNMNDVLYSSSKGSRAALAEVRLKIINDDGCSLPPELADLPEIEIIRKLYRSGDSEYRLNGKSARLKDIHYLFMDTGAGTRAYSIVDQGQVGSFVEMTSQERRSIIEEAAGISRYKTRRIEAEKRMEQTRRNLERVEDLLSEIDRQRKKLARQAKKAERFIKLRKQQETLEKALSAFSWKELRSRLAVHREKRKSIQTELGRVQAARSVAGSQIEKTELAILENSSFLAESRKEYSRAQQTLRTLASRLSQLEKALIEEDNRLRSAARTMADLAEKQKKLLHQHHALQKDVDNGRQELLQLEQRTEQCRRSIEEAEQSREMITASLEDYKVILVDAAAAHAKLDGRRKGLKDRKKRLQVVLSGLKDEFEELASGIETGRTKLKELGGKHEQESAGLNRLMNEQKILEAELKNLREEADILHRKCRDVDSELTACRTRLRTLRDIESSGEGCSQATRFILDSFSRSMGILADYLDVEPGWERAVEAALGESIQAVLVGSIEDYERIAAAIAEKVRGTADIIIAEACSGTGDAPSETSLQTVVRGRPPAERVLSRLLARWHMADNPVEALKYLAGERDGSHFVTAAGEIIHPWGEVVVPGRGKASGGILVRKAEISRLSDLEASLQAKSEELRSEEESIGNRLSMASDRLSAAMAGAKASRERLNRLDTESNRLTREIETCEDRVKNLEYRQEESREELLDVEIALEETEEKIQHAYEARIEAEGHIKGREAALRQQNGVLARRREALESARIECARKQAWLEEKQRERKRLARARDRTVREHGELAAGMDELEASVRDRTKTIQDLKHRISTLESETISLEKGIRTSENGYDKLQHELKELQAAHRQYNAETRRIEKILHENEISITQAGQELNHIRKAAWERWRKDLREYFRQWYPESFNTEEASEETRKLAAKIERLGPVNLGAVQEFKALEERWSFVNSQRDDLLESMKDLEKAIGRIDRTCRKKLRESLELINRSLSEVFPLLFEGGNAELVLTSPDNVLESGLDYMVRLSGKGIRYLNLLSGGEKALAAMALIFSIYFIKPSPFCLLDEVDAPLDEANTERFNRLVSKVAERSQVILITHNHKVMETADTLYGVTMEDRGISRLVSVDLVERPAS